MVRKIRYTREGYTEAVKDLKYQALKLNDLCTTCSYDVKNQKVQNCIASVQAKSEEYFALFDKIIDYLEGRTSTL